MNPLEKDERAPANGNACERIEVVDYNPNTYREYTLDIAKALAAGDLSGIAERDVRWINIDGQCPEEVLDELGAAFGIHPLVVKHIRQTTQRPKIEAYPNFLHIVAKMIYYCGSELVVEHMNFILGRNFVISIGETAGDVFDDIRDRIRNGGTQIRKAGADYLLYSLLDATVDGYFDALEVLSEEIDDLEEQVMTVTAREHLHAIREIKKTLLIMNRCVWPLRDVASLLSKESTDLIRASTGPYIRDVYDHIVQVIDATDTNRELLSGLTELSLANTSNKLNEIMKILTIISTIFIPLTFIVGVYGMNFKYMPEIDFRWGYAITWGIMIVISASMVYFFKKKKWF